MNYFNKTEAAISTFRLCFLSPFNIKYTFLQNATLNTVSIKEILTPLNDHSMAAFSALAKHCRDIWCLYSPPIGPIIPTTNRKLVVGTAGRVVVVEFDECPCVGKCRVV